MAVMDKDTRLTFRLSTEMREALEAAAADDHRSVGNLLDTILSEWLEAKGYLRKAAPKRSRGGRE
jgi:hypothetical protein